jgi:hypothetical protein
MPPNVRLPDDVRFREPVLEEIAHPAAIAEEIKAEAVEEAKIAEIEQKEEEKEVKAKKPRKKKVENEN